MQSLLRALKTTANFTCDWPHVINSHSLSLFKQHVWGLWLEEAQVHPWYLPTSMQVAGLSETSAFSSSPANSLESGLTFPRTQANLLSIHLRAPPTAPRVLSMGTSLLHLLSPSASLHNPLSYFPSQAPFVLSLPQSRVCLYVHAHVWSVSAHTLVSMEIQGGRWLILYNFIFWRQSLSLNLSSLIQLGWPANEHQGSSHLHSHLQAPSREVLGLKDHAAFTAFHTSSGDLNSGPSAYVTGTYQVRHFPSPTLFFFFFVMNK